MFITALPAYGASPPSNRIPFQDAQRTALTKASGKVETASLEEVNGVWLYTFDVRDGGRGLHRITIDALTGQVVPNPNETKR